MTLPHLICEYCSHRADSSRSVCEHCGAPLPGAAPAPSRSERALEDVQEVVETTGALARMAGRIAPALSTQIFQWQAIVASVGVLVVMAVGVLHSCSFSLLPTTDHPTPVQALPPVLRAASSCEPFDANGVEKCVIAADAPLLSGGLAGGQEFMYYAQVDPPDRLAATINRWRSAGGVVLSDAGVFVEIGPSDTVWYADTHTGFHLETGTFASRASARTFLLRSGLTD